mmetsp:Transcript_42409/g.107007  ORF Transcript_42409/g.107007 Transcript_42409/m.107007 type:complete len:235 (+) Transcript_42409:128-832(+)
MFYDQIQHGRTHLALERAFERGRGGCLVHQSTNRSGRDAHQLSRQLLRAWVAHLTHDHLFAALAQQAASLDLCVLLAFLVPIQIHHIASARTKLMCSTGAELLLERIESDHLAITEHMSCFSVLGSSEFTDEESGCRRASKHHYILEDCLQLCGFLLAPCQTGSLEILLAGKQAFVGVVAHAETDACIREATLQESMQSDEEDLVGQPDRYTPCSVLLGKDLTQLLETQCKRHR